MNDASPQSGSVFVLSLVMLLGSCAGVPEGEAAPEDRLTVGKVQGEIKVGQSGAEVAEILGAPNIVTTDEKRRETWVYDKISTERTEASSSSYGTLLLVGGSSRGSRSSTRQRTLTIVIKFDEQKMVRDFSYNYTQF